MKAETVELATGAPLKSQATPPCVTIVRHTHLLTPLPLSLLQSVCIPNTPITPSPKGKKDLPLKCYFIEIEGKAF